MYFVAFVVAVAYQYWYSHFSLLRAFQILPGFMLAFYLKKNLITPSIFLLSNLKLGVII